MKFKNTDFITSCIGIDTEADTEGKCFLVCLSNGVSAKLNEIPEVFFKQNETNFSVYNLKYDSGNILRLFLNNAELKDLWKYGNTKKDSFYIEYIPHKFLSIQKGKVKIKIWDISQFYKMSLDKASKKYLGKGKIEITTKKFTKKYIDENIKELTKYCIHDAALASELTMFLIEKLKSFGINTRVLYSYASLSIQYFSDKGRIVDIARLYKAYPELIKYAIDSYQGGKFEVTEKGYIKQAYEYDIISAYPYEISNLADLRFCKIIETKNYLKDAYYGFIRCKIELTEEIHITHGLMDKNTRIYPMGTYFITVTKIEYEYYLQQGIKIKILSAFWIFIDNPVFPYKEVIDSLFKIKAEYKNKDETIYNLAKYIMNSFYGKTVQLISKLKRENDFSYLDAGSAFNPLHGSIITANTRLKVTKLQNELKKDCIAVHTDSVISKKPIPEKYIKNQLGHYEFKDSGETYIIACGCYQIGNTKAFKGFAPKEIKKGIYQDWIDLLTKNKNSQEIPYSDLVVPSWFECAARNNFDDINRFTEKQKVIGLNADIKRLWERYDFQGKDYLTKSHKSQHRIIVQTEKPSYW